MRRLWIALIVASLGWGTAGVAIRVVLDRGVGPFTVASLRGAIAAVAVVGLLLVRRTRFPRPLAVRVGIVMGVTNFAVPYLTSNVALQHASAGFVGVTTGLIPLVTAMLAHYFIFGEHLSPARFGGLTVGFLGVVVLISAGDSGLTEGGQPVLAGVLSLVAVVSIALGSVYAKRHAGGYDPFEVTGVHFVSGAIIMVVAALVFEGLPHRITGFSWAVLVFTGLACTYLPFALYYWMLRQASVTFVSLAGYLVPPIAVLAGLVVLGEQLQPGIVLGGVMILVGLVVSDRTERRPVKALPVA